jgi:phosphohistidine phosphatase SixA
MRVYVVRHATPEDNDYELEPDPELDKEGRKQAKALAAWMVDKEEIPTVLLTSPAARTQQTAKIIAEEIAAGGFAAPEIVTDVSLGPEMSIKAAVERAAADKSMVRVGIVSHHESIEHGMRVLNLEPWIHFDMMAQCELRILKVDRKDFTWKEHRRIAPSDIGGNDRY